MNVVIAGNAAGDGVERGGATEGVTAGKSRTKRFDYSRLPLPEIAERYRRGESWHSLARQYECPDQKTLARYVTARVPDLPVRDRTLAQRTRRAREGVGGKTVKVRRAWWEK